MHMHNLMEKSDWRNLKEKPDWVSGVRQSRFRQIKFPCFREQFSLFCAEPGIVRSPLESKQKLTPARGRKRQITPGSKKFPVIFPVPRESRNGLTRNLREEGARAIVDGAGVLARQTNASRQ